MHCFLLDVRLLCFVLFMDHQSFLPKMHFVNNWWSQPLLTARLSEVRDTACTHTHTRARNCYRRVKEQVVRFSYISRMKMERKHTHTHTERAGLSVLSVCCGPSTLHGCSQLDTCHPQQPCRLGGERGLWRELEINGKCGEEHQTVGEGENAGEVSWNETGWTTSSQRGAWQLPARILYSGVRGETGLSVQSYCASQLPGRRFSRQPPLLSDALSPLLRLTGVLFSARCLLASCLSPYVSLIGVCGDVAMCQLPSALIVLYSGKTLNALLSIWYVYVAVRNHFLDSSINFSKNNEKKTPLYILCLTENRSYFGGK